MLSIQYSSFFPGNLLHFPQIIEESAKNGLDRRKHRLVLELDFLSLSPVHNCRTDPFMQFWDPLAANCYNISCGYHFENRNGGCFYRNVTRGLKCSHKSQPKSLNWWQVR